MQQQREWSERYGIELQGTAGKESRVRSEQKEVDMYF